MLLPPFHPADAEMYALGKSPQLLMPQQPLAFAWCTGTKLCLLGILDDTGLYGLCFNKQKRC